MMIATKSRRDLKAEMIGLIAKMDVPNLVPIKEVNLEAPAIHPLTEWLVNR